ncbi:Uncharacterised protein [Yersinia bercovieri]|nr:Uncharacterised protein [Yersinia bercovieri]CNF13235.1 Uncharacterised protein [Yersinia bercovieri]CNI94604.1 Uncharacterised protein [Yersinia bercovieri]
MSEMYMKNDGKNPIHDLNRVPGRLDTESDIYKLHNSSLQDYL